MTEQPTTEEELTCSWQRSGDFCLHPVEKDGDLCPHHQKLWKELKAQEAKKAKRKPKPEPESEYEAGVVGPMPPNEPAEPTIAERKPNGAKKKPSKYERQKRVIRLAAGSLLESGRKGGLTARQVEALAEMLDVLGFLQEGADG